MSDKQLRKCSRPICGKEYDPQNRIMHFTLSIHQGGSDTVTATLEVCPECERELAQMVRAWYNRRERKHPKAILPTMLH